jgi:hypothetical protein
MDSRETVAPQQAAESFIRQQIADKLIRRAEYNERAFGVNAALAPELRRLAKEILDEAASAPAPAATFATSKHRSDGLALTDAEYEKTFGQKRVGAAQPKEKP